MTEKALTGKYVIATYARGLAFKKQEINDLSEQITKAEADLKNTKPYQAIAALKESRDTLIEDARDAEKDLRTTALKVATDLKIKDPAPGITVSKKTTFTIDDHAAALEACRENYPQLIEEKIKKPALKKIVVALGEPIAGTTLNIEEYGQVKIASDLASHYRDEPPF